MERTALIIDHQEDTRSALTAVLQTRGYRVYTAETGSDGLSQYGECQPGFSFIGMDVPDGGGADFLNSVIETNPNAHVIVMADKGKEQDIIQALRLGAVHFLVKPLNLQEVNDTLNTLEKRFEADVRFDYSLLTEETKVIHIPNDLNHVSSVVTYLTRTLLHYFDEQTVHGIQGSLNEMIVNAIEHGNLGISYEEKTEAMENDELTKLLYAKGQDPACANRQVRIEVCFDQEQALFRIEDEGAGFDVSKVPDPGHPDNLSLGHGRGILMTRALMDDVYYNDKGNQVTLIKKLPEFQIAMEFEEIEEVLEEEIEEV